MAKFQISPEERAILGPTDGAERRAYYLARHPCVDCSGPSFAVVQKGTGYFRHSAVPFWVQKAAKLIQELSTIEAICKACRHIRRGQPEHASFRTYRNGCRCVHCKAYYNRWTRQSRARAKYKSKMIYNLEYLDDQSAH